MQTPGLRTRYAFPDPRSRSRHTTSTAGRFGGAGEQGAGVGARRRGLEQCVQRAHVDQHVGGDQQIEACAFGVEELDQVGGDQPGVEILLARPVQHLRREDRKSVV